jgi:phospholipase/carboxylesterase
MTLQHLKRVSEEAGEGAPVLVLLHGRGSHMGDLQGLTGILSRRASLITPQAPHPGKPWGYGPGWAWYRYLGGDRVEGADLSHSLSLLDAFLKNISEILGFEAGPLVLGGFSQGGTVSLAYALTHPGRVAGVVNLSGFLVSPGSLDAELAGLNGTPVFWGHGTKDPAVPFYLAQKGRGRLREAGIGVQERDYAMGHWVSQEEMADLRDWLAEEVPGWEE